MKNWNISSLKFVNEMYDGLCAFFGSNADETTEAELHQQLIEAGSLAQIRAAALKEANEAVAAQMADFQNQLVALSGKVTDLEEDAGAKTEKVAELETELENVKGQLTEKDGEIAGHLTQIQTLSGTVASLQAGKPIDKTTPPDASKPVVENGRMPNGGRVVSQKEVQAILDGAGASN